MLNADVFNLTLWLTPNCTFSAHVCIILLSSHTLSGHCMHKRHSRTQQHLPLILQLQLRSIGKARSEGGEGEQQTMLTIAKQDEEATLVERPRLQTAFAVILLVHFLSLRDACAPEHALLMSQCSQCTPKDEKSAIMMVQMWPADSPL